jgi:multidrug efflux pump subunit AcrA (membrane-fusion protein)
MAKRSVSRLILPALALAGALFSGWHVLGQAGVAPRIDPPSPPPQNPFVAAVAGLGEVEPNSETVAVATEVSGVVAAVLVRAGDAVAAGQALFTLDDRSWRAALAQAEAELAQARASVQEARASRQAALAERERASADAARFTTLVRQDFAASRQRYETALADSRKADAQVALAEARIAAAEAQAARAEAASLRARVDLDRTVIRAPITGHVLRVNLRAGEFAQAGPLDPPLLAMGALDPLHVRLQVDEADAWRLGPGAPARAFLRGDGSRSAPVSFVRIEPQARPKRFLSNAPGERTDTRVVEVLYRLDPAALPVQVGQMLDVFVEAPPRQASRPAAGPRPAAVASLAGSN